MCEVLRFGPLDNSRVDSREFTVGSTILYNGWNNDGTSLCYESTRACCQSLLSCHMIDDDDIVIDDSVTSVCSLDRLSYLDGHLSTSTAIIFTNGRVYHTSYSYHHIISYPCNQWQCYVYDR